MRKCSFRFLLIWPDGQANVITQDVRRKRNVVTGHILISYLPPQMQHDAAVLHGCSMIVRFKEFHHDPLRNVRQRACIGVGGSAPRCTV